MQTFNNILTIVSISLNKEILQQIDNYKMLLVFQVDQKLFGQEFEVC
jgi:hypothetical protein